MGELWIRGVRGVSVCLEYFGNDEANEKFFTDDGWARTGDIVRLLEDGNIQYCDRDKDALKVGGENVSAREVEDAIRAAGAPLEDVAVVAKSHDMLDMVPVAFAIQADPNADEAATQRADHRACTPEPGRLQGARVRSTSWTSSRPPSWARSPRRTSASWPTPSPTSEPVGGPRRELRRISVERVDCGSLVRVGGEQAHGRLTDQEERHARVPALRPR